MSADAVWLQVTNRQDRPCRLDELLARALAAKAGPGAPAVSKTKLRRLLMAGAVRRGDRALRDPGLAMAPGDAVQVRWEPELFWREKSAGDIEFELAAAGVVYEDDWLIVVDKPAGLPSEATVVAGRDHLAAAVRRFLARRDGTAEPYLGLHHRLDRETSGLIVFGKDPAANPGLHRLFAERLVEKTYLALALAPPRGGPDEFAVDRALGRISPKSAAAQWGAVADGLPAHTDFALRERWGRACLVEARPRTGRTHQIRVHLALSGMPIVGDGLYGGPAEIDGLRAERVMLHAAELRFPHPRDGRAMALAAPPPPDFQRLLERLRR